MKITPSSPNLVVPDDGKDKQQLPTPPRSPLLNGAGATTRTENAAASQRPRLKLSLGGTGAEQAAKRVRTDDGADISLQAPTPSKRRKPGLKLDLGGSPPPAVAGPKEHLPPDLAHPRKLSLASEQLGNGAGGVVLGLLVDGKKNDAYVVKAANVENHREPEAVQQGLLHEIKINSQIDAAAGPAGIPNVVVATGVKTIDGLLCMIMPRINGGTLDARIDGLYQEALAGKRSSAEFVDGLRDLVRGPMEGLAALHGHKFAMNDMNRGNFLFDERSGKGVVIDLGLAGKLGDHVRPGTVGTMPPERMRSSDTPPSPQTPSVDSSPLTDKADAYAFGAVLFSFVHHEFPSWCRLDPRAPQDQRLLEMQLSVGEFRERGSLFSQDSPPAEMHLRGTPDQRSRERELRGALVSSGFYELVDQLTHPNPQSRLGIRQAIEYSRFFNASAKPSP